MSVLAYAALSALVLPPLGCVLAALLGLVLIRRRPALGAGMIMSSLAILILASTPFIGERMLRAREAPALAAGERSGAALPAAQAIVILGGGLNPASPEYADDTVSSPTLERLRYGAVLQRRTGLPILVSGGRPYETRLSEAETMRQSLETDFRTPARWVEEQSLNTRENAERSRQMLARESIDAIYLVTHAWHMPRARRAFERAGFKVTAAPTGYTALTPGLAAWVPSAPALRNTHVALREWLGEVWYRLNSMRSN
jgi:uncharacterized SAM-binding protein YcdF (DUF218 family)